MTQINIQASNIKCSGCISNIENGLKDIADIKKININVESNVVNIEGENLDKTVIETKLSELGYPAVSR